MPETEAAAVVWHVIEHSPTAFRFGPDHKPVGLDWSMIVPMLQAHGLGRKDALLLLPMAEAGAIAAMRSDSGDDQP
jgi:hypothetical protein